MKGRLIESQHVGGNCKRTCTLSCPAYTAVQPKNGILRTLTQVITLKLLMVLALHLVMLLQGWGHEVICGDVDSAFASGECDHILEGEVKMGGQEHFYLEPQGNVIIPLENDEMCVISSTQVGTFSPFPCHIRCYSSPLHLAACSKHVQEFLKRPLLPCYERQERNS